MQADEDGPTLQEKYYPLTFGGKLVYWTRSTYGIRHFIEAGLVTGIPSISSQPVYPEVPAIDSLEAELAYDQLPTEYGVSEQLWRDNLEENMREHGDDLSAD